MNNNLKTIGCFLTLWSLIFTGSGIVMKTMEKPAKIISNKLKVEQVRDSNIKTNEIKLKEIELEYNQPLSINVKDYLENLEEIDLSIVKNLKLDTSLINIQQAGNYIYTISYDKKKYNGNIKIKEKELPKVDLTLKNIKLPLNSDIKQDIKDYKTYINENLSDEILKNIIIDLQKVNPKKEGTYEYTVTYNKTVYTGKIEIYEEQNKELPSEKQENDTIKEEIKNNDEETSKEEKKNDNEEK